MLHFTRLGTTEELALQRLESFTGEGYHFIPEASPVKPKPRELMSQDEKDLDDQRSDADRLAELGKLDFIKALAQTDVFTRFRYLLQKYDSREMDIMILELLCRLTRHSLAVSSQILHTPALLDTILHKYFTVKAAKSTQFTL